MKLSYKKIWKFHFFVVYLYYKKKNKRTKQNNKLLFYGEHKFKKR